MKKAILACLLATSAMSAFAEWTKIFTTGSGIFVYIDFQTIRKNGDLRKVWAIFDKVPLEKDGTISWREQIEINCKEEIVRILYLTNHTGPMASGKMTSFVGAGLSDPEAIPPGSSSETILKIVCAK